MPFVEKRYSGKGSALPGDCECDCGRASPVPPAGSITDTVLLNGLFKLTDKESSDGRFVVVLDYDNYQDGARVFDCDGRLLGSCYDVGKTVTHQFRSAIAQAIGGD